MPLTTKHATRGRLDVTLLSDEEWTEVYVTGSPLTCPECAGRMLASVSSAKSRFFRHYRRPDGCQHGVGETPEHLAVKRRVIELVRAVPGWEAVPEVAGEGWRADVLATGPAGQRVAWEVQVSSIRDDIATERTRRLAASGVPVCWIDCKPRGRSTLGGQPRVVLQSKSERVMVPGGEFKVYRRSAADSTAVGGWRDAETDLPHLVDGVCRDRVTWDGTRWAPPSHRDVARDLANEEVRREAAEQAKAVKLRADQEQWLAEIRRQHGNELLVGVRMCRMTEAAGRDSRMRFTTAELAYMLMAPGSLRPGSLLPGEALDRAREQQMSYGKRDVWRRWQCDHGPQYRHRGF